MVVAFEHEDIFAIVFLGSGREFGALVLECSPHALPVQRFQILG